MWNYSAGIENISYDSIAGLNSPMFIRTVKLKDFPWNGWLTLGVDGQPTAAWNPIAGMTDRFGQLMWFAVGDLAALPSPYESGWVLNRIAGVQSGAGALRGTSCPRAAMLLMLGLAWRRAWPARRRQRR